MCSKDLGSWQDEGRVIRTEQVRAAQIKNRMLGVADRASASQQYMLALASTSPESGEQLRLVNSKTLQFAASLQTQEKIGLSSTSMRVPTDDEPTPQQILHNKTLEMCTSCGARLRYIEGLLSLVHNRINKQARLSSLASAIFNARLNTWTDAAAPAGVYKMNGDDQGSNVEFSAGASIEANLRSLRSDVDVVIHLGTPFNGPE